MARPDLTLLNPAHYPFSCEIQPRYTDLDTNAHINNVAYVDLMQEARVRFHHASAYGEAVAGMTSMAASFSIEYLGQGFHPDPLTVHVGISAMGRTSHTVAELMMQNGAVIAFAQAVLVCVDNGKPAAMPDSFRQAVGDWMVKA